MLLNAEGKRVKLAAVKAATQTGDGTVSTGWISRTDFLAGRAFASLEAASGSPTSLTATLIVEDATSDAGAGSATYATIAAAGDDLKAGALLDGAVDLKGAREYVRVSSTLAFTGGSSPAAVTAVGLALTGAVLPPV